MPPRFWLPAYFARGEEDLAADELDIRTEYSATQNANVNACAVALQQAEQEVVSLEADRLGWYLEALNLFNAEGRSKDVLDKVENINKQNVTAGESVCDSVSDLERALLPRFCFAYPS